MLLASVAEQGGARLLLDSRPLRELGAGSQAPERVWCWFPGH